MLSIEEKILMLNSLRLLPVAALRFTFYALRFLPVPRRWWSSVFSPSREVAFKLLSCQHRTLVYSVQKIT